jgi:hypothetical protein
MTDFIHISCPECHGTGREYVPHNWDIKPCACLRCGGHGGYSRKQGAPDQRARLAEDSH